MVSEKLWFYETFDRISIQNLGSLCDKSRSLVFVCSAPKSSNFPPQCLEVKNEFRECVPISNKRDVSSSDTAKDDASL